MIEIISRSPSGYCILRCHTCLKRNAGLGESRPEYAEYCGSEDRPCPRCQARELAAAEARQRLANQVG
jgi:hypothetical protein